MDWVLATDHRKPLFVVGGEWRPTHQLRNGWEKVLQRCDCVLGKKEVFTHQRHASVNAFGDYVFAFLSSHTWAEG